MSTRHERREQRLKERRKQQNRRVTGKRVTPPWVTPLIVAGVLVLAVLGLRQMGVFEPPPPPLDIDDIPTATAEVGTRETNAGNSHVTRGQQITYSKLPPTSGSHWDLPHAGWGVLGAPAEDELVLHNLEHGGIAIQYKPGLEPQQLADLQTLVRQLNQQQFRKVLLRPYLDMEANIVLTAWMWRHEMQQFDRTQIVQFVQSHYGPNGQAPEPNAS